MAVIFVTWQNPWPSSIFLPISFMYLANGLSFYYVPGSGPHGQPPDSSSFLMHPHIWLGTQTLEPGAMGSKLTPPIHACVTLET